MGLYGKYLSLHLKIQLEYKASFILTAVGQFLSAFSAVLSFFFLFARFHQVEDFTFSQVLLCFSVIWMAFSLAECFARGFDRFSTIIANGEFDRILVRPRGLILQVLGQMIDFSRLGKFVQAVLVFAYGVWQSGVDWTPTKIAVVVSMVLCGFLLFFALFLVGAALTFFTLEGLEVLNIFTDGGREFASYPLSIYGREVLTFCTFVIPLALVQYYPLLYLLDRAPYPWYGLLPLASLLFFLPSYALWRYGVKKFQSTGS